MRPLAPRPPEGLRRTLRLLGPHLRDQKLLLVLGLLAVLLEVLARLAEPWPLKVVVDTVLPQALAARDGASGTAAADGAGPGAAGGGTDIDVLLVLAAVAALLAAGLRALGSYGATLCYALLGAVVTTRLRDEAYRTALARSLRQSRRLSTGDMLSRLTGDIGKLQEVAVTAGLPLVANVLTFVGMAVVMVVVDPVLATVVLGAFPLFLLGTRVSTRRVTRAAREQRAAEGSVAGQAAESLGALGVVQAYRLEPVLAERFHRGTEASARTSVTSMRAAAGLERSTDLLIGAATAVVLLVGARRVLDGALTVGELVVFTSYLKAVFKPMRNLAKHVGRIARATASGERVAALLEEQPEVRDTSWARPLGRRAAGDLQLLDVTAGHEPGRPVLRHASLHVRPGERVGLVGPSGAGKSTVAALLLRLVDPDDGEVRLDGHDLRDLTLASLRGQVAVVLQESVLFTGTVRENVRWGRPDATDQEVEAAVRAADAHDFVSAMPDGYDTVLAERGSSLSGGQRQRLAIARALLRDAPVVVLDEPTTGLDPTSRTSVQAALGRLTEGRTTLVIAHHEELVATCDRVYEVRDGGVRLVRQGRRTAVPRLAVPREEVPA